MADALHQLRHQVLSFPGNRAGVREVIVAAEGYLDAVHVETASDLLDRPEMEVPHLAEREIEGVARLAQRPRREVSQDELRVIEHPPGALCGRAVVVAEPCPGDELHPAPVRLVAEYLDGIDAPIQHGHPAAMLRPLIVLVGVGVEVQHPPLSEDLLPKRVGPTQSEVVDEPADLFGSCRIADERLPCVTRKVGDEEQADIAPGLDRSRSRRCRSHWSAGLGGRASAPPDADHPAFALKTPWLDGQPATASCRASRLPSRRGGRCERAASCGIGRGGRPCWPPRGPRSGWRPGRAGEGDHVDAGDLHAGLLSVGEARK